MKLITFNIRVKNREIIHDIVSNNENITLSSFVRDACSFWLTNMINEMEKPEFFNIYNLTHPESLKYTHFGGKYRNQTEETILTNNENIKGFTRKWIYGLLEKYDEGLTILEFCEKTGTAKSTVNKAVSELYYDRFIFRIRMGKKYLWKINRT